MFAIPLAWLQLKREKVRLLIALAGIGFAVFLMFLQLGFKDALFDSAITFHKGLKGDVFMISSQSTALLSMKSFPDRRAYSTLGVPNVENVSPIYLGFGIWKNPFWKGLPDSQSRSVLAIGINPARPGLAVPGLSPEALTAIQVQDIVLFDKAARPEFGPIAAQFPAAQATKTPIRAEVDDRRVEIAGLIEIGASFAADGNLIMSETTFRRIFTRRSKEQIDIAAISLKPGSDVLKVLDQIKQTLPGPQRPNPGLKPALAREDFVVGDVRVLSHAAFLNMEKQYWQDSTSIGFIFTLGAAIGFVVGTVIVYQILYTDVADHLAEYATLKAMGYKNRYLLNVVFQESLILSVMGFIPGYLLSTGMYALASSATALPIGMTTERGITVLCLTILMCLVSGAIAVRKVQDADPADIF
jgi:putative ABC transport system permease protein